MRGSLPLSITIGDPLVGVAAASAPSVWVEPISELPGQDVTLCIRKKYAEHELLDLKRRPRYFATRSARPEMKWRRRVKKSKKMDEKM